MSVLTANKPGDTVVFADHYPSARRVWAVVRIALGWTFLWAFLDKTFALGFATGRADEGTIDFLGDAAWISGGSPTEGFLTFATKGPLVDFFQGFAGAAWADWLFMLALLGLGIALIVGVAIRIAAVAGAILLVLMWAASAIWPTNNPFLDDHLIYAAVLAGLALTNAGDTWGLGKRWSQTDLVERYPILK